MSMEIKMIENATLGARLVVVGVGGGGNNAVNNMVESGIQGVEFVAANTDIQALERSLAPVHLQIGRDISKGLGAGGNPEVGRGAALEDRERIKDLLDGSDMVFVTAGMGGGTGTGAAPIVAEIAKEVGALTVAVVTTPFEFEGKRRMDQAKQGVEELKKVVDTVILIPNTRLRSTAQKNATFVEMLKKADGVLRDAVRGISDLIVKPGLINLDFADVRTVMSEMGMAMMGTGQANGDNRTMRAVEEAIKNPLLNELTISGARSVLINMTVPPDITMDELEDASNHVREMVHEDANIIWGCVMDDLLGQDVRSTIIATGINAQQHENITKVAINGFEQLPLGSPRGTLDINTLDPVLLNQRPYARNISTPRATSMRGRRASASDAIGGPVLDDDQNRDIPTYLRRQAD